MSTQNEIDIREIVAEYELDELDGPDITRAVEMLAEGIRWSAVVRYMQGWNQDIAEENRCDSLASADFEERAHGRD
jgi:hypothetical protein